MVGTEDLHPLLGYSNNLSQPKSNKIEPQKVRAHPVHIGGIAKAPETAQGPVSCLEVGAGGGNRTHTPVKVADFKLYATYDTPYHRI